MILEYPETAGITVTRNGTNRYWFKISGKLRPEYSVWIEVSEEELVKVSCDCEYQSFWKSNKFESKDCRHVKQARNYLLEKGIIK